LVDTTRKIVDRSFTAAGIFTILLAAAALLILLVPIIQKGAGAFLFRGTLEHREAQLELFGHGNPEAVEAERAEVQAARQPVFDMIAAFEAELRDAGFEMQDKYEYPLSELKDALRELLGPLPGDEEPALVRERYGETRWDRAQVKLEHVLKVEQYDYSDPTQMGKKILVPRVNEFEDTSLKPLFAYVEQNAEAMLNPQWTLFWRFLTEESRDAHFFGGIKAELLGTFYLALGSMLFAIPMGIISAIYLVEYANDTAWIVRLIRTCITTLAGVPSIVFGLFGLAFFINTMHVSQSKSVLAGSVTLAVLILPLVIRASEEALRAVPIGYKEASLSLGASKWHTIMRVLLPASLPGIITGIVISLGRAAGETAPIIFTAAVSVGAPLAIHQTLTEPTPALPWGIYNLATEHAEVDEIRHVQYGMVLTLIALVLVLNGFGIYMRAWVAKRLRG
jgi:phosphate transport system permease protein